MEKGFSSGNFLFYLLYLLNKELSAFTVLFHNRVELWCYLVKGKHLHSFLMDSDNSLQQDQGMFENVGRTRLKS